MNGIWVNLKRTNTLQYVHVRGRGCVYVVGARTESGEGKLVEGKMRASVWERAFGFVMGVVICTAFSVGVSVIATQGKNAGGVRFGPGGGSVNGGLMVGSRMARDGRGEVKEGMKGGGGVGAGMRLCAMTVCACVVTGGAMMAVVRRAHGAGGAVGKGERGLLDVDSELV